jgi:hypothetical protein
MGAALVERVDRWYQDLPSLRPYQRARKNRQLYYGLPSSASPFDVSTVAQMGDQGELTAVQNNRFHHLGQRMLTLAVQDDFGWQPQAANADTLSIEEAILASSVLEYEKRNQRLTDIRIRSMEMALVDAWAHWAVRWDPGAGPQYDTDPETKAPIYEGRLQVTQHPWWRTVIDIWRQDANHDWVIITDFINRWDVAERYAKGDGQAYERIISLAPDNRNVLQWLQATRGWRWTQDTSPLVPIHTFFHRPTRSVPEGRMVVFTGDGSILQDGASPYGEGLPVGRVSAGEMMDTPFGSTPLQDIAALQSVLNMTVSTAVTNASAFGVQNVVMRADANLSRSQFDGMNVWEVDGAPGDSITALTLANTAPEIYNLAGTIKEEMSTLVGLNSVSLGQQTQQMSGALAALLDSKSQQFASLVIAQDRQMISDMGTAIIDRYKRFAKAPRPLEVIAGSGRAYMLKDFVGEKISGVSRVTVEVRSGLMSTTSGKLDFIEKLVMAGDNPELRRALYTVYKSGNLDTAMGPEEREDMLIRQENDLIARGIPPPVRVTDPHVEHIKRHREPLSNPTARTNEAVAKAHDDHVNEHLAALRQTDPELLQLIGQPVLGMPPPPEEGAPAEGGPPPPGAPDMGGSVLPPEPQLPGQPSMPNLPTTGEEYVPPGPPPLA